MCLPNIERHLWGPAHQAFDGQSQLHAPAGTTERASRLPVRPGEAGCESICPQEQLSQRAENPGEGCLVSN